MSPPAELYAISLWQPWASFVAIGIKPFETRDWAPPKWLIGKRIAIHAAKRAVNADDRVWAAQHGVVDLPLGAIVCTALLTAAYRCGDATSKRLCRILENHGALPLLAGAEVRELPTDEFGDYAVARWAWRLAAVETLNPPIFARGAQGLWKWQPASTPQERQEALPDAK
jgi:activating signal cointegrator 1